MSPSLQGTQVEIPAGTLIIREHEISRKMFLIRKGKVRVFKKYMNQKVTLAILGEGEVFGELSFFDARPRSASIEALTDLSLVAIDGQQALAELPEWIMPLLRSAFHRFREADQKITVLQSMQEYQKKNFKQDKMAQTIYLELLRFLKTLSILYSREQQALGPVKSETLLQELDDVLGNRNIGLRVFWRVLKEHDFIDHQIEESEGRVVLNLEAIGAFTRYLNDEAKSERYLLLNHTTIALIRRILGFAEDDQPGG